MRRSSTSPPCRCARSCRARPRRHDRLEVVAAELLVELEPEPGQLERDVRVEPLVARSARARRGSPRDRARLVRARDLLAEHVDRRQLPLGVQPRDDAHRVVERAARRCSAPRAAARPARHGRQQPDEGRSTIVRSIDVERATGDVTISRMKPWRAALTSATASGKRTRIASRRAIACSSALPVTRHLRERRRGRARPRCSASASRTARAAPPAPTRPAARRTRAGRGGDPPDRRRTGIRTRHLPCSEP